MLRVDTVVQLRAELHRRRSSGKTIGFVPTMGAFHDGHMSLIKAAAGECDVVVVSVFVNPIQFERKTDFQTYPREDERDARLAAEAGVDLLFAPSAEEMYPDGFRTRVEVEELSGLLCGAVREGHFSGVATVVTKLLEIVRPDVACFGEKDYQQLVIVRRLAEDLNLTCRIVGVPTVREQDGLAMSSRNQLLSSTERRAATVMWRALAVARQMVEKGEKDPESLLLAMRRVIGEEPLVRLEYLNVVDPDSLRDVRTIRGTALVALAAYVGTTRLIDNVIVRSPV